MNSVQSVSESLVDFQLSEGASAASDLNLQTFGLSTAEWTEDTAFSLVASDEGDPKLSCLVYK